MPSPSEHSDRPLRVRVTVPGVPPDFTLNIPGGGTSWDGCEFVLNPPDGEPCDFWFVLGFAREIETARVAPENTLFICGEPPAKKRFPRAFYRQFHRVIDTHGHSRHPRLEIHAPCLGWGIRDGYQELPSLPRPAKQNKVGVLCSSSTKTSGQRRRVDFLKRLKTEMGDDLVHFGRGFQPVENRMDAILPYRFQLVLENSRSPHYWTEKLASAYAGWAFPIYHGCPNLAEYFPGDSYQAIDIDDFDGSLKMIRGLLASEESDAEREAVRIARERLIEDYDLIKRLARLARRHHVPAKPERVVIRHYKAFRLLDRLGGIFGLGRAVRNA